MSSRQWLLLLVLATGVSLLLITRPDPEPALRSLAPSPVLISHARATDLAPVEVVSGHLQPARRVWLRLEVDARVDERVVEPGARVEKGTVLLRLDASDYQDAFVQAEAEWLQAKRNLERDRKLLTLAERSRELQEAEVARIRRLGERSLASKTLLGDSQALLAQRQSEEARLRASVATGPQLIAAREALLDRARRDLERTTFTAPFMGRVNRVELEVGDYGVRNQQAVELIGEAMDFYAQVRGPVARALSPGQVVAVSVDGIEYDATTISVQPDPDPATFTHAVRLRMPAGEQRSGAAATARLPLQGLADVLVVPITAILQDEGDAFVFRIDGRQLERVAVELGARVGSEQVVARGLQSGDAVVVRDVAALADGQAVIPEALQTLGDQQ